MLDYIGNTVVQKIFEYCCQDTKLVLLQRIAPYLAPIGIHKNGTWAIQKIIELAHTEEQVDLICHHLSPFVPLLLLDSIGNYVIQQCLPMGSRNQFIFEAIVENCIMIGQGRFGSRSIRAILASSFVTKKQQVITAPRDSFVHFFFFFNRLILLLLLFNIPCYYLSIQMVVF